MPFENLIYDPNFYFCKNLGDAKKVILGAWGGLNTDERWKLETEWLVQRIKFDSAEDIVIDYGCGVGRIAKEIENPVLGVDFSQTMRLQADVYVGKDSFSVITPEMLQVLFDNGLKVSGAMSVWAFQHIVDVEETIDMLMKGIKSGGIFWLLDINERYIPCLIPDKPMPSYESKFTEAYACSDKKEIRPMIAKWCELESSELMPIYTSEQKIELRKYRRT